MMLFFKCESRLKFVFLLTVSLILVLMVNSKYTFNKFSTNNLGQSSMESAIRNYAMNLADTKMLKITHNLTNEGRSKKEEKQIFNKFIKPGMKSFHDENLISGSVLVSDSGELTFTKEFVEEDDVKALKGRKLIARARYTKSLHLIGWSKLYVETFDNSSAEIQSWAAGFLEGKLCAKEILDFYKNLVGIHSKETTYLNDVFNYYKKVEESIRYRTSKSVLGNVNQGVELEYWISVAMTQAQTDGLLVGYNTIMKDDPMNVAQIYFLNADGEVPELLSVFKFKKERNNNMNQYSFREGNTRGFMKDKPKKFSKEFLQYYFDSSDPEFIWNKLMTQSHCSAIIKVLRNEDQSVKDVLVAHTTWDSFSEMHRIVKTYKFAYTLYGTEKKESNITFSSYPGTLTSTDDFYLINNKLVVLETTLEVLDRSLYETKIPNAEEHVPNYIRISVSNRMAKSGKQWTEIFRQNNGGTYNSQWMILDFEYLSGGREYSYNTKNSQNEQDNNGRSIFARIQENSRLDNNLNKNDKFYSNHPTIGNLFDFGYNFKQRGSSSQNTLLPGFFHVLEQIPGHIEVKDMTNILNGRGFWASYNRPYFEKIYRDAGYYDMMTNYGKIYSYEDNPRAKLILSQINSVHDIEGLKKLMRRNSNLTNTDHINTISPRYDLSVKPEFRRAAGGIDTKIVSHEMLKQGALLAISGPSNEGNLSPFSWSNWKDEPHYGLPDYWNFDWVVFNNKVLKNDIIIN